MCYKCKKEGTLLKHMNTRHEPRKCIVCSKTFASPIELLQHIAKKHKSSKAENVVISKTQDLQEDNITKITKSKKAMDDEEKTKVLYSVYYWKKKKNISFFCLNFSFSHL